MGNGIYDTSHAYTATAARARTGRVMAHAADVDAGRVEAKVHPNLDPKRKNRDGKIVRESRDNAQHPNSVAVAVMLDTTGSMVHIPEKLVRELPSLMGLLISKGYLADPQILFGAVNDASTNCIAPLEVGQFESGNQMDDALSNILVSQGGGGGGGTESYELAMYFLARKTELDCVEKRNKKGYLFIVGDETPYDSVSASEVSRFIGDKLQADIPTTSIIAELKQKFNVFWLFPAGASNSGDKNIQNKLKDLFGQNFIHLKSSNDICPTIAAAIAINEGRDPRTVAEDLRTGLAPAAAASSEIAAIVAGIPPRRLDDL